MGARYPDKHGFVPGKPHLLFETPAWFQNGVMRWWDISLDGQRVSHGEV
jgi:hypothetical protein